MGAMTSLASIIALLAIAAAGAWAWVHDRARKLAEKRAREESERLVAERWVAHEIVLAEAEVRINARLQVEAEERIRKEAEAKEEVRLVEEHRLAAEKQAAEAKRRAEAEAQAREEVRLKAEAEAEAEAKRWAEAEAQAREEARLKAEAESEAKQQAEEAQAQAREEARLKAEAEAKQQAEEAAARAREEARLKAQAEAEAEAEAEAKRRAEEAQAQVREEARRKAQAEAEAEAKRQAEEAAAQAQAQAQAQAREEARRKAQAEAEAEAKRRAEAEAQAREEARLKAEAEAEAKQQAEEAEARARELPKARGFSAPKPSPISKTFNKNEPKPGSTPRADNTAPIRLQLVFGRGSAVRMLALVPHRRDGMPSNLEVTTINGTIQLAEWSEDTYQPIPVSEFPGSLSEGLVWQAREGDQQWRWELTRRELYVLAAGDEFGLHGFVTRRYDQCLWLNTKHVVLAKENLRESVITALAEAGCQPPTVYDATTPGVPSGWFLIRDVIPTRAVPIREERDPLNVLCPAHEIEPQLVGGIRLERNVWLAGFAPRIRFDGELEDGFEVRIDSHPAQLAADGALEAPGWDDEGEHRLWFGGQAVTYVLRTMREEWDHWQAYDFGTGAAICGATTHWIDGARWRQVRIPAANPLLVGARPGEIFYCQPRTDVRSETIVALVPFAPVWALPLEPVHADKRSARLVSLESLEPATMAEHKRSLQIGAPVSRWATAINDAGRKQLALSPENEATQALWRRYRAIAKQLWKQGKKQR